MLTYYNHRPLRGFCLPSYIHIVLNITPTLYEGYYIVSVHRMVILWKIVLLTLAGGESPTYILHDKT